MSLRIASVAAMAAAALMLSQPTQANLPLHQLIVHQGGGVAPGIVDGPFNINCTVTAGCDLVVTAWATVGDYPGGGTGEWSIYLRVNGTCGFSCTIQGLMRTDIQNHGYETGSIHDYFHIPMGNNTVELDVGIGAPNGAGSVARWQATYEVFR